MRVSPALKNSTLSSRDISASSKQIGEAFGTMERHAVDLHVARALCANGIPFNVFRNPDFCNMVKAINNAPKGYKARSYDKARTSLLDECKRVAEKDLTLLKDTWYTQVLSIIFDGCTNIKYQTLLNVIASNSRGSMFLYAEDFSRIEKTGVIISKFLLQAIDEIRAAHVSQVVTDNTANCKAAGREIEKVHKHLFWSPCVVHTLNLIFKDFVAAFDWMRNTYKRRKVIVKYFLNHSKANAIFIWQSNLELLKVAKTRIASRFILLKRLKDYREALATTIALKVWRDSIKNSDEKIRVLCAEIAYTVNDEEFLDKAENVLNITLPIVLLIKFADGESPKIVKFY